MVKKPSAQEHIEQPAPVMDTHTKQAVTKKRHCPVTASLASLLLAISALGFCGYNLILLKQNQHQLQLTNTDQTNELNQKFIQLNNISMQQQAELAKVQQAISSLPQVNNTSNWYLQEISYLLRLADLNLKYQHDPAAALTLLTTADELAAKLNDPQLDKFRQQLAKDITTVQATQAIDMPGLLAKLNALSFQAKNLPALFKPEEPQAAKLTEQTIEPSQSWWQNLKQQFGHVLQKLVIIHHYEQNTQPLITKEQQNLVVAIVQLHFQQAEWAALHYQQDQFQQHLQQAYELIQTAFSSSPQKVALLNNLVELQKMHLTITPPDLSSTLAAIPNLSSNNQQPSTKTPNQTSAVNKTKAGQQETTLV